MNSMIVAAFFALVAVASAQYYGAAYGHNGLTIGGARGYGYGAGLGLARGYGAYGAGYGYGAGLGLARGYGAYGAGFGGYGAGLGLARGYGAGYGLGLGHRGAFYG